MGQTKGYHLIILYIEGKAKMYSTQKKLEKVYRDVFLD